MTDSQSNVDHLHEVGALNKADLNEDHIKAINSLSKEEVEQLKAMHKNVNKGNDVSVGVAI